MDSFNELKNELKKHHKFNAELESLENDINERKKHRVSIPNKDALNQRINDKQEVIIEQDKNNIQYITNLHKIHVQVREHNNNGESPDIFEKTVSSNISSS